MDSYLGWWRDAGLIDAVGDQPCDWFAAPPARPMSPAPSAALTGSVMTSPPEPRVAAAQPVRVGSDTAALALPPTLAQFDSWLETSAALPGAAWSPRCLPTGPAGARIMLLSDTPDIADVASGTLFADAAGRLLDAMLAAIGESRASIRLGSIAVTRPVAGRIGVQEADALVAMARHHVTLVRPRVLVLLGQQTAQLLGGFQPDVNHEGTTMVTLAVHHPRLLLERPSMKRQTWDALKSLREPD